MSDFNSVNPFSQPPGRLSPIPEESPKKQLESTPSPVHSKIPTGKLAEDHSWKHFKKDWQKIAGGAFGGAALSVVGAVGLVVSLVALTVFTILGSLPLYLSTDSKTTSHAFKVLTGDIKVFAGALLGGAGAALLGWTVIALECTIIGAAIHAKLRYQKPFTAEQTKELLDKATQIVAHQRNHTSTTLIGKQLVKGTGADLEISREVLVKRAQKPPSHQFFSQASAVRGKETVLPREPIVSTINVQPASAKEQHEKEAGILTGAFAYGGANMQKDHVVPTSAGGPHLTNCYILKIQNGGPDIIRTGVINTAQKAAEFRKALDEVQNPRPDCPLRLVSNQLNSPEAEERSKRLISDQHRHVTGITSTDKHNKVEVAHLNTPSNRILVTTEWYKNNTFFANMFASKVLTGEQYSAEQNVAGLATYTNWMTEDIIRRSFELGSEVLELTSKEKSQIKQFEQSELKKFAELNKRKPPSRQHEEVVEMRQILQANNLSFKKHCFELSIRENKIRALHLDEANEWQRKLMLNDLNVSIQKAKAHQLVADIGAYDDQIKGLQEKIKNSKSKDKESLIMLQEGFIENRDKLKIQLKETRAGLRTLLLEQSENLRKVESALRSRRGVDSSMSFDSQKASEQTEKKIQLMYMLLESQLGNASMSRAQEILIMSLLNLQLDVIEEDNCKSGLDRTGFRTAVSAAMRQMLAAGYSEYLFDLATKWDEDTKDPFNVPRYVEIFRELVLKNLLHFGLPITQESTGLLGLKWHKSTIQQNLLPLKFLPPQIKIKENDKSVLVPLVEYENGEPKKLAPHGVDLLLIMADHRES